MSKKQTCAACPIDAPVLNGLNQQSVAAATYPVLSSPVQWKSSGFIPASQDQRNVPRWEPPAALNDANLTPFGPPAPVSAPAQPPALVVHHGIGCDGCNKTVEGIRHKCLDCAGKLSLS